MMVEGWLVMAGFNKIKCLTPMQQLHQLIAERTARVAQVSKDSVSSDRFRILKEEERIRLDKQNGLLSMMRANKSLHQLSKHGFYTHSYHIMRKIRPEFEYEVNLGRLEDHFLNDFVGMFRQFFHHYEQVFNFKVKIQNLIRPTNHNLIFDLVKYLVDFSRDYYQQTCFWYVRSTYARAEEEERQEREEAVIEKKLARASLNELMFQRENSKKMGEDCEKTLCEKTLCKKDGHRNYQVLDIAGLPPISSQPKDGSTNVQMLKIKVNQFYRDLKSRNNHTKANLSTYYTRYHGQNIDPKPKEYLQASQDSFNQAIHPFKVTLTIQKNGFNFINVSYSDAKTFIKGKEKKLSPLRVSQRLIHTDQRPRMDFITNLKIIRISDSFLPPLIQTHSLPSTPQKSAKLIFPFNENSPRTNLLSSNSAANDDELMRKMKKKTYHQISDSIPGIIDKSVNKNKSYRKLNDLKRTFKSQDRREGNVLSTNSSNVNPNDPQKKIFDWLQKLRQVKEIQRKKIMGLS